LSQKPAFIHAPEVSDIWVHPDEETATVGCMFETPSDPPWKWFKATVDEYHDQGVRFFLSWIDDDNIHRTGVELDGELIYTRFGEFYTDLIKPSIFKPSEGYRGTDGPITLIFNRRTIDGDAVWEVMIPNGNIVTTDESGNVISIDGKPFECGLDDYDPTLAALDCGGDEVEAS
jgi:hypothetical protein